MKAYKNVLAVAILLFFAKSFGQEEIALTAKDSIVKSSWMAGLGYTIIDDSGDVFDQLFDADSQWNMVAFPSRASIGRYFESGIGVEAIAAYSQYKEGKIIDGVVNDTDIDYWSIDTRLSYDLNKIIGQTAWFDPYVGVGLGYTDANNQGRGTYNAVVGFRTWLSDNWGIDLNSSGKWSIGDNATNHIQHAAGVVYQFGIEKGLSKKGEEKLALIEELEKERQRVADSIATAKRAEEEAKALAERLAREKREAELAAAEKARQEAEQKRKQQLLDAIESLGKPYFALNSSYLGRESKSVLDGLATLLAETPTLKLRITAHADSRGAEKYNQWLSERRAKRVLDYLTKKGVEADRLIGEGLGETQLTNHCKNDVPCSEAEHRVNRRTEFLVVEY
ncbi:OmpA family protein [Poritiphilus flavus]|uniref:OmpA family protein n=1 Tax=Poritiphilus flavus TaxID=2697053 RepID=A0A6L9EC93_9FLAO|nr:OmpA family protein [Poritiphilus flavus]NAS12355.1 OmpA family protein [Poritiphilus flavus]